MQLHQVTRQPPQEYIDPRLTTVPGSLTKLKPKKTGNNVDKIETQPTEK